MFGAVPVNLLLANEVQLPVGAVGAGGGRLAYRQFLGLPVDRSPRRDVGQLHAGAVAQSLQHRPQRTEGKERVPLGVVLRGGGQQSPGAVDNVTDSGERRLQVTDVACVAEMEISRCDCTLHFVRGARTGENNRRPASGGKLGDDMRSDEAAADDEYA